MKDLMMKTNYYSITMTAIALGAMVGCGFSINAMRIADIKLDNCAKEQNVYACNWVAVPSEPHRTQIVQADILPPPVYEGR